MPSTYSSNLKIELMSTGENSGTWGNITNTNLGTALEQAVVGYGAVSYASDANLTISITNSNAAQAARALVLNVTSAVSLTGTRELVVPTIEKQYIVQNNTTGSQSITVKTSAGTGITVPNGRKAHLYVDGTNVIQMFDFVDINGGTIDGTPIGGSAAAAGAFTTLNASGATTLDGNVALGNASGDLITFPGTINSHLLFTDNTYDIGANGATRPRNLFLAGAATIGGNLSVGGTLTLTGGLILNGNVTVGDNASDTLTINSTITSNLIFTDNTYDIGASGATRPRNLFLAGSGTIGGNVTTAGRVIVDDTTDSSSTTTGSIQTDGGLGVAKALFVGTTLNVAGNTTLGDASGDTLTINGTAVSIPNGLNFDSNLLVLDATNNYVGINRSTPIYPLDVNGVIRAAFPNPDVSGIILQATTVTNAAAAQIINGAGNFYYGLDTSTGNRLLGAGSTGGYQGVINVESNYPLILAQNNTGRFYLLSSGAVFNETGADYDFRVESDGNTHMLFVDAGTDTVNIGGTPPTYPGKLNVGGGGIFSNATNFDPDLADNGTILLGNINDGGGFSAPGIGWKNSGTGNTAAVVAAGNTLYLGTGDASTANSLTARLNLSHLESVFNEGGLDVDFRVESDTNTHAFFLDAGNSRIGINQSAPETQLHIGNTSTTSSQMTLAGEYQSGTYSNTNIINFQHGAFVRARIRSSQYAPSSDSFVLNMEIANGSLSGYNNYLKAYGTSSDTGGEVVINDDGLGQIDFRVESDTNTHMLFVDAGNDVVSIGTSTVPNWYSSDTLQSNTWAITSLLGADQSGWSTGCYQDAYGYTSNWKFKGNYPATLYAQSGDHAFFVTTSARGTGNAITWREALRLSDGAAVFNEESYDIDFRVESDTNTHALFVDAGNSRVGINNSSPAATLSVTGVPRITSPNFSFATVDKEVNSTTGIVDFTFAETTGSGTSDNLAAVVIISIYQPSTSTTNEAAGYVGLRLVPRGGGGTLVQIASQQGSGISTFTVAANGDGIRVTTDTSPTLRCRLITLGGGGTSVPSE